LQNIEITPTATSPSPFTEAGCPPIGGANPFKTGGFGFKGRINTWMAGGGITNSNIDEKGSIIGLKKVPFFFNVVTNKLTRNGVFALAQGAQEGVGTHPSCKNPGNITGPGNCGPRGRFKKYASWEEGWLDYTTYLKKKTQTIGSSAGVRYADCYMNETNATLQASGVKYNPNGPYNNTGGKTIFKCLCSLG